MNIAHKIVTTGATMFALGTLFVGSTFATDGDYNRNHEDKQYDRYDEKEKNYNHNDYKNNDDNKKYDYSNRDNNFSYNDDKKDDHWKEELRNRLREDIERQVRQKLLDDQKHKNFFVKKAYADNHDSYKENCEEFDRWFSDKGYNFDHERDMYSDWNDYKSWCDGHNKDWQRDYDQKWADFQNWWLAKHHEKHHKTFQHHDQNCQH
jgi:hypothetical protein